MDKNPRMRPGTAMGKWSAGLAVSVVSIAAAACGTSSAAPTTTPTAIALSPTYAKSAGFPKTLRAAKSAPITSQKGCTSTIGAVYEDSVSQTALITSILKCDSQASASSALSVLRKHYATDPGIAVPKALGASAFASSSIAPQYLMVWHTGSKVAIIAVDTNLAASRTTTSTAASPPLTKAQEMTLYRAAEAQNALLN
jgi:hypothetical protein